MRGLYVVAMDRGGLRTCGNLREEEYMEMCR